jgi:phosphatidylglycerophosphate synthase
MISSASSEVLADKGKSLAAEREGDKEGQASANQQLGVSGSRESARRSAAVGRPQGARRIEFGAEKHEFKDARRVQESFCAPMERRALEWLAARMPEWVTPDHLTAVGLAGQFFAGACFAMARRLPASLVIVDLFIAINWFGDSLDGTLARYRNKLRPRYGFYVDHIIDTYGALFLLAGLTMSGYISERVAVGMLIGFLLLSVNVYLSTYTMGTFRLSFWKFSPTEMRILLAIGSAYAWFHPYVHLLGRKYLFFDVGGVGGIIGMIVIFVASTIQNTIVLYKRERI